MLAAHIQSVDLSYHVGKKTIGLKRMRLQGSSHTESLSNWQNEEGKGFSIQSAGFWSVKAHGCSMCVSPGWQGKPLLGRVGSLQTPGVGFLGMWSVLSVGWFVPLVGSSRPGACSEYAFVSNVRGCLIRQMLLGWVRCSGTTRNTSILFLTFLMEWDSKVIWFLRNWTMIFKCRGQWKEKQSFSPVECRMCPSVWTLDLKGTAWGSVN